jgi:EmrB/QacA subfamily drug resistance transporter
MGKQMNSIAAQSRSERVLTPEILTLAVVVVLGTIMTILDATIVNVALATLGREFGAPIPTIQWVATAYLLAFASVIPLTGWAAERFGTKPVWLGSLGVFMISSLLSGLSWSVGSLIAFRVLQGLGAGMILPLGQTMLAQAAGPQRIGRVMSLIGVPMLLAPIFGPVIGGAILDTAGWRWIFFVNLPVGALALGLAVRLLPDVRPRARTRLDGRGLALLSGGIALFVYGLAEVGARGRMDAVVPLAALGAGLLLVALFVLHALRTASPLIDVRLFARRAFATAAATNFLVGTALFGMLILLPLYFQLVRGETPLHTGLLLIPQGVGAAVAMPIAGMLTDRVGARFVVVTGVGFAMLGTAVYTRIASDSSYWSLSGALFLVGLGLGSTIMPSMAVAYQGLARDEVPRATSAINAIQRIAGSLGTALLAVVLQRTLRSEVPSLHGGIADAAALAKSDPAGVPPLLAEAFGTTFTVALALAAVSLVPAFLLPRRAAARHPSGRMATS